MSKNDWIKLDTKLGGSLRTNFNMTWALTENDIMNLANFIYDPPTTLKELFLNSSNYIASLMVFPFYIPEVRGDNGSQVLSIGGVSTRTIKYSPVTGRSLSSNMSTYFLGQYFVTPKFNNFADYNGYSQIEIWLPFYGIEEVSITDVLNKYLQIFLTIDYNTGQGSYAICVDTNEFSGVWWAVKSTTSRIIKTCTCQVGVELPLGKTNATDMRRNTIMAGINAVVGVATNSYIASSGMANTKTQSTTTTTKTKRNTKTGRQIVSGTKTVEKEQTTDSSNHYKLAAMRECFDYGSTALLNMHMTGHVDRSNNPSTMGDFSTSVKIIRYYPKLQETDENYNKLFGKPYGKTKSLSELTGFTIVSAIHFEGSGFGTATEEELAMIEEQFTDGVIL